MLTRDLLKKFGLTDSVNELKLISSTEPPGEWDFDKLLEGKLLYRRMALEKTNDKFKTVVITDWSSCLKFRNCKIICELFHLQVPLYAWTGALVNITSLDDFYTLCSDIRPAADDTIFSACAHIPKSQKEIFILDYFKMKKLSALLHNDEPCEDEADSEVLDLYDVKREFIHEIIASLLCKENVAFTELSYAQMQKQGNYAKNVHDIFSTFTKHQKTIYLSWPSVSTEIRNREEENLYADLNVNVTHCSVENSIAIDEFFQRQPFLKKINFDIAHHEENLTYFQSSLQLHTPKIINLTVSTRGRFFWSCADDLDFTQLKALTIRGDHDYASVAKFIARLTNLKKLDITSLGPLGNKTLNFDIDQLCPQLKSLTTNFSHSFINLNSLINHAHLQHLILQEDTDSIAWDDFKKNLSFPPSLKKLTITSSLSDIPDQISIQDKISGIEWIKYDGSADPIFFEEILDLINLFPDLKKVYLLAHIINVQNLNSLSQEVTEFNSLVEFNFHEVDIDFESLYQLTLSCPNLKYLHFVASNINNLPHHTDPRLLALLKRFEKLDFIVLPKNFFDALPTDLMNSLKPHPNLAADIAKHVQGILELEEYQNDVKDSHEDFAETNSQRDNPNIHNANHSLLFHTNTEINLRPRSVPTYFLNKEGQSIVGSRSYFETIYDDVVYKDDKIYGVEYLDAEEDIQDYFSEFKFDLKEFNLNELDDNFYYGQKDFIFSEPRWYRLPLLLNTETLPFYQSTCDVKIGWGKKTGFFYVKPFLFSKQVQTVAFVLRANPKANCATPTDFSQIKADCETLKSLSFDEYLNHQLAIDNLFFKQLEFYRLDKLTIAAAIHTFYSRFGPGKLKDNGKNKLENLNALKQNTLGSCLHRSMLAFLDAKALKIPCRILINKRHAFICMYLNGKFIFFNLGGYPSAFQSLPLSDMEKIESLSQVTINPFVTWRKNSSIPNLNPEMYCALLEEKIYNLPEGRRNASVKCHSQAQIEQFNAMLSAHLTKNGRNYFYLPKFSAITEQAVQIQDNRRSYITSPFMRFVTHGQAGDVLVINATTIEATDAGHNSIFNEERTLGDNHISKQFSIIIIVDKVSFLRLPKDLLARIYLYITHPSFPALDFSRYCPTYNQQTHGDLLKVNLNEESDFLSKLLGKISTKETFAYKKQRLLKATKNNPPGLILKNPPWNSTDFRFFMAELLFKKQFYFNGNTYSLPSNFKLTQQTQPYVFSNYYYLIQEFSKNLRWKFILNMNFFPYFFQLNQNPGWLKKRRNKIMPILVTQEFPENLWIKLLDKAHALSCTLSLILAPGITVSPSMREHALKLMEEEEETEAEITKTRLILTNDIDFTLKQENRDNNARVFNFLNNTLYSAVTGTITLQSPLDDGLPKFSIQLSDLWQILTAGKEQVIFIGTPEKELAQKLETLFSVTPHLRFNGKKYACPGEIMFIMENTAASKLIFTFAQKEERSYSSLDFWHALAGHFQVEHIQLLKSACDAIKATTPVNFNFTQLQTMLKDMQHSPHCNPLKPYLLVSPQYHFLIKQTKAFFPVHKNRQQPFLELRRLEKITNALKHKSLIVISGASGSGKKTAVLSQLEKYYAYLGQQAVIFFGESQKLTWARSPASENAPKILFLTGQDASNLDAIVGALRLPKPGIQHQELFIQLNKHHKIIIAVNLDIPQHQLFTRYGVTLRFKPFSGVFLRIYVLRTTWESLIPNTRLLEDLANHANSLLDNYFLINKKLSRQALTPPNLRMIAMRTVYYLKMLKDEKLSLDVLINFSLFEELIGTLSSEEIKKIDIWSDLQKQSFKEFETLLNAKLNLNLGSYVLTQGRRQTIRLLQTQLAINAMCATHAELSGQAICGMLLEGETATGKSEAAVALLRALGYQQASIKNPPPLNYTGKIFYLINAATHDSQVIAITSLAFDQGAALIFDETRFAEILQSALSGFSYIGKKALRPGFFLIATQNPISYANRDVLPSDFLNKFFKLDVKEYTYHDLLEILQRKGMIEPDPRTTVVHFLRAQELAKQESPRSIPSLRQLFCFYEQYNKNTDKGKEKEKEKEKEPDESMFMLKRKRGSN